VTKSCDYLAGEGFLEEAKNCLDEENFAVFFQAAAGDAYNP